MQPDTFADQQASCQPVSAPASDRRLNRSLKNRLPGIGDSLHAMVVCGFVLRILGILLLHTWRVRAYDKLNGMQNFSFGYETGRIAASIANGFGFANPFDGMTGPTAWVAPLYPYLTAGVFRIFGTYSHSSAFVLLAINSLFSALTAIPVYLIAKRVYGDRVGRWSGWTWTLLPYAMYWGIKWIWETSLSAFLVAVLFWLTLKLENDPRFRTWLWWGALWGLLALVNPACLSFLLFAGLWVCWRRYRQGLRWFVPAVASALIFIALITPWEVRNYQTFHKFIFIRGNLGVETRLGNAENANGMWMWWLHPTQNAAELAKYKKMGEVAYVAARKQEVVDFIHRDPAKFVKLCATRAVYYWAGVPQSSNFYAQSEIKNALFLTSSVLTFLGLWLTIRRRKRAAFLFTTLLLVYPCVYYLTFPHARYRHPIEPLMVILVVYLFSESRELRAPEKV
ncbi:MAG TPA: glycosyltransferase family 39 protein [Terriglobales bacterium]|jgi:4-amino-4-deoxy-L-arabinose transferase-like glycosyltransferase|nr:glycosyltransferase family 39 protein [Terriglobales bacterium]